MQQSVIVRSIVRRASRALAAVTAVGLLAAVGVAQTQPSSTALVEGQASGEVQIEVLDRPRTEARNDHYVSNRQPLTPSPFIKLPLGAVKPQGWLRTQLELMADGVTGRLPEVSGFVQFEDSAWVGPEGRGEHPWEEVPYWLKGYGNLGYLLGDQRIIDDYTRWVEGFMQTQRDDGYFGPRANIQKARPDADPPQEEAFDLWPNMIMLDVLISHYEATGDQRVIDLMRNYFKWQLEHPREDLLPGYWDNLRGGDNLNAILWLYNHTGDKFLLDAAEKMHDSTAEWTEGVVNWHGVNFTQGFREPATWYQLTHDSKHHEATLRNYRTAIGKYGQVPGGMFAADENAREGYDGPRQAAETCSMVEFMHSFQMLGKIDGDPTWADRCEEVAFNDFPASHTHDLKALHYLTAPNQIVLDRKSKSPGIQNGGDMFSYKPRGIDSPGGHRCCQHNTSHGWPYFTEHLWMATPDNGLVAFMYAPSTVTAKVGDSGTEVTISEKTKYPFEGTINLKLSTPEVVEFPLLLRIPEWTEGATIQINGQRQEVDAKPQSYVSIERTWKDGDTVTLTLPQKLEVKRWEENRDAASVRRGPLWYSLQIGEEERPYWREGDWEAREVWPTTPWNYGLVLDESQEDGGVELMQDLEGELADQPFAQENAPIRLKARGRQIPNWTLDPRNLVREIIDSPVKSDQETEELTLIPMGAARLRVSAFPVIGEGPEANVWPDPLRHVASHVGGDIGTISDGILPESSSDASVPRFTWWPHRGTSEWLIYDLNKPRKVEEVSIYWFDDTGRGACRVPASWTLEYEDENGEWQPVPNPSEFGTKKDQFNRVTFDPVMARRLRINVNLQPEMSAGLLEVYVGPRPKTAE